MSTIREVSRMAGVSATTVSRVLNGSAPVSDGTRERVLDAVRELDYHPNAFARGLVTNRSGGIGVTVNDFSSPFFGPILQGIEQVVEEAGMHLMVASGHARADDERQAIEFLRSRRADALILYQEGLDDDELIALARAEPALVALGRSVPEIADRCVDLDNEAGGWLATRHLIENGHRRIAHVSGPLRMHDGRERLIGYRRALTEAGIPFDPALLVEADFMEPGGFEAARRLLSRDLPEPVTAIFAANDESAAGVLAGLRAAGLSVPNDISLVGYDDLPLARYLHPGLTTVRQPLHDMGRAAAHVALARLDGNETEVRRRFEPQLVVRSSARPLG